MALNEVAPQIPGMLPSSPGTDVLGNPTPAGMVAQPPTAGPAALSAPPTGQGEDESLPLAPPSGGATLGQRSPTLRALAQNANLAAKSNPKAAAAPGGWARTLLAGVLPAVSGLENGMGDAAAVGTVSAGGGALTGVTRTLAARDQRLKAEKQQQFQNTQEVDKNKALNAEANARMIHEQQLTHNLKEEGTQASLKSGQEQLAAWKSQPNPGIERAKGLTADQAKEMLKKDNLDPTEETLVPSGVITTVDKDGQPYNQLTYSVVKVTPVDLDPKNPEQKKVLDRINSFAPPESGKKWEGENGGAVHFSGAQYNMLLQMSNERQAADIAAQKVAAQMGIEQEDVKKSEEALKFRQDPNIIRALGAATTINGAPDFISARNALLQASQNPKSPLYGQYTNVDNDMRQFLGYTEGAKGEKNYIYDKMIEDYQKKVDAGTEQLSDLKKELNGADGQKAASIAGGLQAKIDDPATPAPLKAQYIRMRDQAAKQSQASLAYDADKKQRETAAENQANTGDMSGIMDMVKNYDYDPDKLFSRFKDLKAKRDFISQVYAETGQKWSDSEYKARYATKQDYRPEGKGGQAVQSLNTFAEHTGDANNLIANLNNTKSPLLNKPLNKWDESVLGQPQVMQYRVAVAAAADNYINYLLNNKAKHASDDDLAAKLQSTSTSPAQAQAMMRQMANTIALKAREQNFAYRKQMGKDIPEFLDPDTVQIFKTFGINPDQITTTGQSGLTGSTNPGAPKPPQGAQTAVKDAQGNIIGYR
jgi:hypothetical protein